MRLVFAGTPAAALPTLRALAASRHTVAAVVTRPDAPAGRGKRMQPSPVAELADELGLETLKPAARTRGGSSTGSALIAPDCCPVTAYGALLPQAALDIPPHGWVNLHFSVLPAWRGAAPVQHAVLRGDDITGATTFLIVKELDAGPVFGTLTEPIRADRHQRRPARPARRLRRASCWSARSTRSRTARSAPCRSRPTASASRPSSPRPTPASTGSCPPHLIDRQVRGCTPDPGAWTEFDGGQAQALAGQHGPLKLLARRPLAAGAGRWRRGGARAAGLAPASCASTATPSTSAPAPIPVRLGDVQPQGKRRMPAADWARGLRIAAGRPAWDLARHGQLRPQPRAAPYPASAGRLMQGASFRPPAQTRCRGGGVRPQESEPRAAGRGRVRPRRQAANARPPAGRPPRRRRPAPHRLRRARRGPRARGLRQPAAAQAARGPAAHRPRRRARDRARLRHPARPGHLRRGARRVQRPPAGKARPAGARRAAPRHPPAAQHPRRRPRRRRHLGRPGQVGGGPAGLRLRQRGAPPRRDPRPGRLAGHRRPEPGDRPRRPPGDPLQPPALDRRRLPRRPRRRRRRPYAPPVPDGRAPHAPAGHAPDGRRREAGGASRPAAVGEEPVARRSPSSRPPSPRATPAPGSPSPTFPAGPPRDEVMPAGRRAGPLVTVRVHARLRRPGAADRIGGRAAVQDEGSQLAAIARCPVAPVRPARGAAGRREARAASAGSTCAPAPAASPACCTASPPSAARG